MKRFLTVCLAFGFSAQAFANTVPLNVSVSAQDASPVNIAANAPFGVGPDGKAHRFAVTNSGQLAIAGTNATGTVQVQTLQPVNVTSVTLTGSTSWQALAITCSAQPCNTLFYNASPNTLIWWADNASATPAFAGISMSAGATPLIIDSVPGQWFHWRWDNAAGNGFLQTRY